MLQQQDDQQAPDPSVAVEIGVNGFELSMQKSRPDEFRQSILGMDVFLECAEELWELVGGRGNVDCVPRAAPANPVLAAADFSSLLAPRAPRISRLWAWFKSRTERGRPRASTRVGCVRR